MNDMLIFQATGTHGPSFQTQILEDESSKFNAVVVQSVIWETIQKMGSIFWYEFAESMSISR